MVFHCFAGDERAAARVVEAGWYVSFAGTVTFRNAPGLRAACAVVPLDRMVLETDSPFLSPHPYRGRPNRPGRVGVTAQTVAEVHGVGVEEVAARPPRPRRPRPSGWPLTAVPEPPPRPLLTPPRVRELLARHELRPRKALGQHYLADPNTARKVARLGGIEPGETVLEVGPGLGSLTLALRQAGAAVVAVEADARLLPALAEVLGDDPLVRVELADALRVDLAALAPEARRLVANLPYNIAATLVLKVLAEAPAIAHQVVMVQREVGERLAAAPGSPAYGAPSAKLAAQATARVLAPVSRHVFVPEPHVDSVLLGVTRRQHPAAAGLDPAELGRVIDAAFGQRRKTLRNALRGLGLDAAGVEALGAAAGVDLGQRAERLDVAAFAALAEHVKRRF